MDFMEFLLTALNSHHIAQGSSAYQFDDMILDSPLPSAFVVLCVAVLAAVCTPQVSRQCWKMQRDGKIWKEMQRLAESEDPEARDRQWRILYRMSFPSFQYLVADLRPYIESPANEFVREPVDTERAVAMVLHRLASGTSPRKLAEMYDTGASTVIKYTKLVTSVLASSTQLYSKYVTFPSGDRLTKVTKDFGFFTGIPNVCGAMAGTHIRLHNKPKPMYAPDNYLCSYGFYSVLLQGVCDSDKIFWDVCCNAPGGLDDSTHLQNSSLWRKLCAGEVMEQTRLNLEGRLVRPFIVGDLPYPIMPFLITPFHSAREDAISENVFDMQLMKGRENITTAFGLLKSRWKMLNNMNTDLRYVAQTVLACCVLHNFCQLAGEPEPAEWQLDELLNTKQRGPPLTSEQELELQKEGIECRRALFWDWLRRQSTRDGY